MNIGPRAGKRAKRPTKMAKRTFDARPDRLDFRDLPYRPPLRSLPEQFPSDEVIKKLIPGYVKAGLILDQGTEGACTGFGLACVVNHLQWVGRTEAEKKTEFASASPRMLYELARRYDEWPGDRYEGSSCRGALKGWHKHGVCSEDFWPFKVDDDSTAVFVSPNDGWEVDSLARTLGVYYRIDRASVVDIQAAIVNIGAVYVSAQVHKGWDKLLANEPGRAPRKLSDVPEILLPARKGQLGGHAFAFVGFDKYGFIVQNSWGEAWGAAGFGRLSYADWVAHGTDAWACAMGVPTEASKARVLATRWKQPSGRSLTRLGRVSGFGRNPADDPWPVNHVFNYKKYEPISTPDAYQHSLVTGNDGEVCVRDMTRGGEDAETEYVKDIVYEKPYASLIKKPKGTVKLAIYAHGGLNNEKGSIERVRVLAPYLIANDIYPLFLVWRTGPLETLNSMFEDWERRIPGFDKEKAKGLGEWLADQKDRALEAIARPLGRGIWSEMRENAERSAWSGHGIDLMVQNMSELGTHLGEHGRKLEVHLIGHSAGSILLGHYLEGLLKEEAPSQSYSMGSCSLYAPACSVSFANEWYGGAAAQGILPLERLWLYYLDDGNEKRDALPSPGLPIYGKSLLYLVSRALDETRKEPLLGMERAHVPKYAKKGNGQWAKERLGEVRKWQGNWPNSPGVKDRLNCISDQSVRITREGTQIQATHGSFDNNIDIITETLVRIRGKKLESEMEWLDY